MTCIKNMFGNQSQMKSQTSRMMERTRRPLSEIEARGSDPSVYVLLYMLEGGAAASFHIRPTYTDDEDVVATQRWLLVASL